MANTIASNREDQEERNLAYEACWIGQELADLGDTLESVKQSVGRDCEPTINEAIAKVKSVEKRYVQVSEFLPASVSAKVDAQKIVSA